MEDVASNGFHLGMGVMERQCLVGRKIIVILAHPCDALRDDGEVTLLAFQSHADGIYRLWRTECFQAHQQGIGLQPFVVVLLQFLGIPVTDFLAHRSEGDGSLKGIMN